MIVITKVYADRGLLSVTLGQNKKIPNFIIWMRVRTPWGSDLLAMTISHCMYFFILRETLVILVREHEI